MLTGKLIRIAIIDDDEEDFYIIKDYIKGIGANILVEWVPEYSTALEKIKEKAYHIYFIDYRLGNYSGLTLLEEASALGCEEPIVILTGMGSRDIDIKSMEGGATDYLVKSDLNSEKLERCIRYSLDRADTLKELKERENKYRNLFEGSKDAIFIADENLTLLEVNNSASELLGIDVQGLIGRSLYYFVPDEKTTTRLEELLMQKETINDHELEIVSQQQEIIPCLLSITFFESSNGSALVHGILHDITNIKKAEIANLQSQKMATNERLMRTLAHEVRNPLNNISLSIDHLELMSENADQHLVEIMKRNCTRINHIITELIDLSKPPELSFQAHGLQEIIDESLMITSDRIGLQKIEVTKQYPEFPLEISANKSKLVIAFTNILINAVEAMESSKGKLNILLEPHEENYCVSIQDNGRGIPEEYQSKLFEPFFTLKKNGVGLGLATSYSIIQSHKANIRIESYPNKGTKFIINFKKLVTEPLMEKAY
jgi:PAS domain S-box-containing protein